MLRLPIQNKSLHFLDPDFELLIRDSTLFIEFMVIGLNCGKFSIGLIVMYFLFLALPGTGFLCAEAERLSSPKDINIYAVNMLFKRITSFRIIPHPRKKLVITGTTENSLVDCLTASEAAFWVWAAA